MWVRVSNLHFPDTMKSCRHKRTGFELEAMISSGVDEGFSGKAKLTGRKAYGLRTPHGIDPRHGFFQDWVAGPLVASAGADCRLLLTPARR